MVIISVECLSLGSGFTKFSHSFFLLLEKTCFGVENCQ